MKNVLITGGAGFIGSNLTLKLIENGFTVRILDTLSEQIHGIDAINESFLFSQIKDKCEFIKGSVLDINLVKECIEDIDVIIHLAAETGTGQSMYEVSNYVATNSLGTANLLDVLVNTPNKVQKFIVASSRSIYGEGKYLDTANNESVYPESRKLEDLTKGRFDLYSPIDGKSYVPVSTDENSRILPGSLYAITKYNQEQMALSVCKSISIPCFALRFQNVYGPGQSLLNPYTGILAIFSSLILKGSKINIFEDGLESRDFVFISDVVDSIILALELEKPLWEAINIGTGVPISVLSVANRLMDGYQRQVQLDVTKEFRIGDIRHNFADLTKAKSLLAFDPKVNFDLGIAKFCEWVLLQKSHDDFISKYQNSIEKMRNRGLHK
jgi:dTDP-L-rhamnose 4-epimerase